MIEIKINDEEIMAAVARLQKAGGNLKPAMESIGEYLTRTTKKRFAESRAPDGTPWALNTSATIMKFLRDRSGAATRRRGEKSGRGYYNKGGRLNKRGTGVVMGKKPLIGESKRLGAEIHYQAETNSVAVGSSLEQAAVMQFGAKKGEFGRTKKGGGIPFGDIPARPYLGLSDEDRIQVVEILRGHLATVMGG